MMIQTATRQGDGRTNQDTIIVSSRAAAVLDGATAWYPQDPARDGGWYSRTLGAQLLPRLDSRESLADLLAESIDTVARRYDLQPGAGSPESTVTVARWDSAQLELLVLGDSPAVVFGPAPEPILILDDRLEPVGAEARRAYREHLRSGGGYGKELDQLLAQLQADEIALRNKERGYWSAESDSTAVDYAITACYPTVEVAAVLLMSDGVSAGVLEYGHPGDWTQALAAIEGCGPGQFIDAVHDAEDTDPSGRRWPRSKCHDDKALILIRPQH